MRSAKLKIRAIFFACLFFYAITARANNGSNYSFIRVDATNGLVNNQVTCIYKDSRGFIWIGTSAGLSRFDGVRFVNYKHNDKDSTSLIDNYIENIQEDKDGNLWIKTRWEYTIFNFEKESFTSNIADNLKQKGINGAIDLIFIDKLKKIWFLSHENARPLVHDSSKNKLIDPFIASKYKNSRVRDIYHDGKSYFCLYENGVIERFNGTNYELEFTNESLIQYFNNEGTVRIFVDKEGDLWLYGNTDGIYHYQGANKNWEHYTTVSTNIKLTSNLIRKVVQDDKGLIWVGTDHGGIDIINKFSGQLQTIYYQRENNKSLSQNSITDIFIDNNNIVWIGTYKKGVCYYHESIHKFPHYRSTETDKNSLPYNDVNCFVEDNKGNLWIGTNGDGLIYFDRINKKYSVYKHSPNNPNSLSNNVIVSLFIDNEGLLWIGTYTGGINTYDGRNFKSYKSSKQSGLTNNNIWTITCDNEKRIWVGTLGGGIVLFDKQKGAFTPVLNTGQTQPPSAFITHIFKMRNGNLFIGTSIGIVFYDVNENRYRYHPGQNISEQLKISNNNVNAVYEDSRGLLWVASREGLTMIDPNSGYTKIFRIEDGLSRDIIINCILEDEYQSIWISKSTGLSQIVVAPLKPGGAYEFSVFHYTEADGLQGQEFNTNSSYKTRDGELIFGGPNGFNMFQTKNIKYNKNVPQVVFTDFQIFNKSVKAEQLVNNHMILKKSIASTDNIVLKHSMNVFSIEFAALDFYISEKVKYKYMLDGFDKEWISTTGNQPKAVYTNLNPGTYLFKVKACNNDGLWNEDYTQLSVTVLPPFYASPIAYLIYAIMVVLAVIYFRYSMLKKTRLKYRLEQERILARRNHEMDEMKLRFLTNVSHEFRTPLTLILTPIEKLKKIENDHSKLKILDTVDRNARSLLDLVNQLLDFRKLDLHGLKYNPSYGDIVTYLKDVCDNFREGFERKDVGFEFVNTLNEYHFEFDKSKLQKVMMNLISNALKFTSAGGNVKVIVEKALMEDDIENIVIKVKDTGIGIDDEEKDKIFERFYQSKNNISLGVSGSGIGLNLAKEMITLHGGTIKVESEPGKGSEFIITIPTQSEGKTLVIESNNMPVKNEHIVHFEPAKPKNIVKSTVLLIEDNFDFRNFMKETLEENYIVHEAQNGIVGFDIVHKIIPDLIISDVIMPQMDGLELCRKLKKDIRTSHIPLILLTARTADEDKIKGLEIGADDYITKPFNMDLLLIRIQNLMEKQREIQNQFQKNISIETSEIEVPSMEEKLIKKAIAFVEKNIDEPKFSVEDLSTELGMSRVYLYKKLLAITGKTPIEFIRIIRLKRGAQLLEKSKMNVAEVAYAVGFNSPRYFSKYFKEEYGVLPNAYIKKYGNITDDRVDID